MAMELLLEVCAGHGSQETILCLLPGRSPHHGDGRLQQVQRLKESDVRISHAISQNSPSVQHGQQLNPYNTCLPGLFGEAPNPNPKP